MLSIDRINRLQYENTKLREFTEWVLNEWTLDSKEVQDKAYLTMQEVNNDKPY